VGSRPRRHAQPPPAAAIPNPRPAPPWTHCFDRLSSARWAWRRAAGPHCCPAAVQMRALLLHRPAATLRGQDAVTTCWRLVAQANGMPACRRRCGLVCMPSATVVAQMQRKLILCTLAWLCKTAAALCSLQYLNTCVYTPWAAQPSACWLLDVCSSCSRPHPRYGRHQLAPTMRIVAASSARPQRADSLAPATLLCRLLCL